MSKYKYTKTEQQINNVLKYQSEELMDLQKQFQKISMTNSDYCIKESEELLISLGYGSELKKAKRDLVPKTENRIIILPSWESLCAEAEKAVGSSCELESIFTPEELRQNEESIRRLNDEYNCLHRLDKFDISISVAAGLLGAAVDILLVGIPQKRNAGLKAGPLSDFIREQFDKTFPSYEMEKLANAKISKVPYDAQDNRNTSINVDGLSAYYHRLLSLGHDPLLGLIFGVFDILTGKMTTIDKKGRVVSQTIENYADRKEASIFNAIAKQLLHFKSDITTSMGLPAPMMALFNFLQFGSIGKEQQTVAEIVQGMYYEGYDFIHFCSTSVPCMLIEITIRIGYAFKRIKEGHSVRESIPFSLNRKKHPKLATMLFIGHSVSVSCNTGKVLFTKNPMSINYAQWLAFAKYSYKQLKWGLIEKPKARDSYIRGKINEELQEIFQKIDSTFEELSKDYVVIMS